ncbi:hypothetical protein ADK77_09630 [Streptomyces antibioticus]|nr:hypothetical protein ADK77_09630 [Streptomyces antibioticus]
MLASLSAESFGVDFSTVTEAEQPTSSTLVATVEMIDNAAGSRVVDMTDSGSDDHGEEVREAYLPMVLARRWRVALCESGQSVR